MNFLHMMSQIYRTVLSLAVVYFAAQGDSKRLLSKFCTEKLHGSVRKSQVAIVSKTLKCVSVLSSLSVEEL